MLWVPFEMYFEEFDFCMWIFHGEEVETCSVEEQLNEKWRNTLSIQGTISEKS